MIDLEIREDNIDGVEKWLWPKCDVDGLWDGPKEDWKAFHKHKIMQHCKCFRVAVQAGGGCGMYPRLLSNIFTTVYTFEPKDTSFYCLVHNCDDRNIIKFNAALGSSPGLVSIRGNPTQGNQGTFTIEERVNSIIPRMTIDSMPYRDCDLLMLDVEGYEEEVLKGAMETMHKFNPVVFVERGQHLVDWMKNLGYEVVDRAVADLIFVREKPPNP